MSTSGDSGIRRRLDRLCENRIRGGLVSVEEAAALASVGFEPVSEVIGAVANRVRPGGFYASGYAPFQQQRTYNQPVTPRAQAYGGPPSNSWDPRTFTSSSRSVATGTPPTITALKAGYRTALSRLISETRAVNADGVVGVAIERTVSRNGGMQLWNFLAVGTAVRSTGRTHATNPFTTVLPAAQVAASIRGGWVPVSILIVPVMAVRYVDQASRKRRWAMSANGEVDALTDVVNTCRHQASTDFAAAARAVHADGAVMSAMTLELEAGGGEPVCYASVTVTGTALAQFSIRHDRPTPLTIIPLNRGRR